MVLAVLFVKSPELATIQMPTSRKDNKIRYVFAMENYTAIRMKELYRHATPMNLMYIILSKRNQT